jgi:oxygen-dependent protoporphyrinogen oxidase
MYNKRNMDKPVKTDIIIIGAGLTGLTTAFYLKKYGFNVVLIEKSSHTGGVINSVNEEGFIYETGPNTGVLSHPEVAELFEELEGKCKLELANPKAKKRLIWKNGKWHALPGGFLQAIGTPLFTFCDKLRILCEPFRKKGTNPHESVAELVVRRMGQSFLDYAVDPFISGIYAGDPGKLVTKYALPKLYNLEQSYGSFIKGAIKKRSEPKEERMEKATREVFSAEGGLGALINALEESIGKENIYLDATDTRVNPEDGGYAVETNCKNSTHSFKSKYVVTTVGAYSLPSLLSFINSETISPITNLEYAKVVQAILGYKRWDGIDINAFGGLVPSKENRKVLGILFTSSFLKKRAPEGGALLSVFIGGTRMANAVDLNDDELKELVVGEVNTMTRPTQKSPDFIRFFRYENAIPQYTATTKERLEAISEIEKKYPGLILAGNIRDGIGMADRIKQAREIAEYVSKKENR